MNLLKTLLCSLLFFITSNAEISYLDYSLVHTDNYRFSTGFDKNYIIKTFHYLDDCTDSCNNKIAKGLYNTIIIITAIVIH